MNPSVWIVIFDFRDAITRKSTEIHTHNFILNVMLKEQMLLLEISVVTVKLFDFFTLFGNFFYKFLVLTVEFFEQHFTDEEFLSELLCFLSLHARFF